MKRVSFKVAKAIKEAGYPQGKTDNCYIIKNWNSYNPVGTVVSINDFPAYGWELNYYFADIPTYLEVWLWLWREKKFSIDVDCYNCGKWTTDVNGIEFDDPEDALTAAIESLVDNDLIK